MDTRQLIYPQAGDVIIFNDTVSLACPHILRRGIVLMRHATTVKKLRIAGCDEPVSTNEIPYITIVEIEDDSLAMRGDGVYLLQIDEVIRIVESLTPDQLMTSPIKYLRSLGLRRAKHGVA